MRKFMRMIRLLENFGAPFPDGDKNIYRLFSMLETHRKIDVVDWRHIRSYL
jgi:hypothetical protein